MLLHEGRYGQAIAYYQKVLEIDPNCAVAYFNLGQAYAKAGQLDQAYESYHKVLELDPQVHYREHVYFQSGLVLLARQNFDQALEQFDKVIECNPNSAQAYIKRGEIFQKKDLFNDALSNYTKAAQFNSSFTNAIMSLGTELRDKKQLTQAIECFNVALSIKPDDATIYRHLGDALHILGQAHKDESKIVLAMQSYQRACDLDPTCAEAHHNLGLMLSDQGKTEDAIAKFKTALACNPHAHNTQFCLGTAYLKLGNFIEGWPLYEYRFKRLSKNPYESIPLWDGSDLQGKKILLHAEQGFGDTFQFIRYVKLIKQLGATTIVEVQSPLKKLLSLCPYIDMLVTRKDPRPACDYQAAFMSLPFLFKTQLNSIPAQVPYLQADITLESFWADKLKKDSNFKIGICWEVEATHDFTGYIGSQKRITVSRPSRSVPLKQLALLAQLKGISLYSLQKTDDTQQFDKLPADVAINSFGPDFDKSHGSFMDTAAIIKNLDLVISADTSVAHLAGALGTKTWILLPHVAEWRWLADRTDTPWYPQARLFRQPKPGDWKGVMNEVEAALKQIFQKET